MSTTATVTARSGYQRPAVDNGDVMFLNDQLVRANAQQDRRVHNQPLVTFDWDKCAKSRNHARPTTSAKNCWLLPGLRTQRERRSKLFVWDRKLFSVRHEDGGAPCFPGVFSDRFETYQEKFLLWMLAGLLAWCCSLFTYDNSDVRQRDTAKTVRDVCPIWLRTTASSCRSLWDNRMAYWRQLNVKTKTS